MAIGGIVGNQPAHLAGVLDSRLGEGGAIRPTACFNVPFHFTDVPLPPGTDQEWNGIIRPARSCSMLHRGDGAKLTVVTEGLRRGLRRDEFQAHVGRLQRRMADRRVAVMGREGGEHHLPQGHLQFADAR